MLIYFFSFVEVIEMFFMKNYSIAFIIMCVYLVVFSCAPSRFVNTLPKGETQLGFSLGGAMQNLFDLTVPTPYSSLVIGHGLRDGLTIYGGIHTTALVFNTLQTDLGVTKRLYHSTTPKFWIPDLSGGFTINSFIEMKDGACDVFPQIDFNAIWKYGDKKSHFFYLGVSNWIDLNKYKAHDELQNKKIIINPHLGNTWQNNKWSFTIEYKILALMQKNENVVVNYAKWHGKYSVPGIFIGFTRKINE